MGSDLVSRILTGNEFQTLGTENRKARDPKVNPLQLTPAADVSHIGFATR